MARKAQGRGLPNPRDFDSGLVHEKHYWERAAGPEGNDNLIDTIRNIGKAKADLMDQGVNPWEGLPYGNNDPSFDNSEYQSDEVVEAFAWSDEEFNETDSGFYYNNEALKPRSPSAAARITEVPTNTTNPDRPRTVAAGYDRQRQVITVVFRDGTFYNYYECNPRIWQAFKMSRSKGKYILAVLDDQPRGPADTDDAVPVTVRAALYNVARAKQTTGHERWQQESLYHVHWGREFAKQERQSRQTGRGTQGRNR